MHASALQTGADSLLGRRVKRVRIQTDYYSFGQIVTMAEQSKLRLKHIKIHILRLNPIKLTVFEVVKHK